MGIKSIEKITLAEDGAIHHYDVNYEEGFVVAVRIDQLPKGKEEDMEAIVEFANGVSTKILQEQSRPKTFSERIFTKEVQV